MINRIKKFLHVAFQNETWSREIFAFRPNHPFQSQHALMDSFVDAAREGIRNENFIKNWIQNSKQCMMQNPVARRCFMNVPDLRITDKKTRIRQMGVFFSQQVTMKLKDVLLKAELKSLNVFFITLIFFEFIPRRKQVLQCRDL